MTTPARKIAGLDGGRVTLMPEQLDELQARVDGPLLWAGDEGWDDAVLVWNGMVTMVPAPVLQPTSVHEVAAAVADVSEEGACATYGANCERPVETEKAYDPGNLFRATRNIRPRA